MNKIQRNLREIRERLGLSREELAVKAKVSYPYIAGIESGVRNNPSLDILEKLADALDVPLDELAGRKPPKK